MLLAKYFENFSEPTLLLSCDHDGLALLLEVVKRVVSDRETVNLRDLGDVRVLGDHELVIAPGEATEIKAQNRRTMFAIGPNDVSEILSRISCLSDATSGHIYGSDISNFRGNIELKVSVGEYPETTFLSHNQSVKSTDDSF